jgi:hypothetical protein
MLTLEALQISELENKVKDAEAATVAAKAKRDTPGGGVLP